ncbi:MAG: hypothetical protein RIK87_12695 [Fuerstiella sp.]
MFTIVPIIIGVIAVFVFISAIGTFLGHRRLMNRITDEVFRESQQSGESGSSRTPDGSAGPVDYSCAHCGASLSPDTEISPSGDFKCRYCNSWSNVQRSMDA